MADDTIESAAPAFERKRKFGEVGVVPEDVKRQFFDTKGRVSSDFDPKTERLFEQEKRIKEQQRRITELESVTEEQETALALASKFAPSGVGEGGARNIVAQLSQSQAELEEAKARIKTLSEQVYELAITPPDKAASVALETQAQQHLNLVHALQEEVARRDAYIERLESDKTRREDYIQKLESGKVSREAYIRSLEHEGAVNLHVRPRNEVNNKKLSQVVYGGPPLQQRVSGLAYENACLKRGLLNRDATILELKQKAHAQGIKLDDADARVVSRQLNDVKARIAALPATTIGENVSDAVSNALGGALSEPSNATWSSTANLQGSVGRDPTKLTPEQEAHVGRRISNSVRGQAERAKKDAMKDAQAKFQPELEKLRANVDKLKDALEHEKTKVENAALRVAAQIRDTREATEKDIAAKILCEVPHAHTLGSTLNESPAALTPTQQKLIEHLIHNSVEATKLRADAAEAAVEDLKARAHQSEAFIKMLTAGNEGLLQAFEQAKTSTAAAEDKLAAA